MHCLQCGCNHQNIVGVCWRCGAELPRRRQTATETVDTAMTEGSSPAIIASATPSTLIPAHPTQPIDSAAPRRSPAVSPARRRRISGTVIMVEQIREEKPDRRWWRILGRVCLALVVLSALPLLLVLCIFRIISFSGMFNTVFLVNMTRRDPAESTQYFRVREGLNREYIVRRKGRLEGHIMSGDEVELQGKFKKGVFHMKQGINIRAGASLK